MFSVIFNFQLLSLQNSRRVWRTERGLHGEGHAQLLQRTWHSHQMAHNHSSSSEVQHPLLTCVGTALTHKPLPTTCTWQKITVKRLLRTRSLVSIWALFLCTILMIPGGCTHASPSTCTGTPSSPNIVILTVRHWNKSQYVTGEYRSAWASLWNGTLGFAMAVTHWHWQTDRQTVLYGSVSAQ